MTQFFLIHFPSRDEYAIKSIGAAKRYVRILRPPDATDEEFKDQAIKQFDAYIEKEQILNGEVVKTGYIY